MRDHFLEVTRQAERSYTEFCNSSIGILTSTIRGIYKTLAAVGITKATPVIYAEMSRSREVYNYIEALQKTSVHRDAGRIGMIYRQRESSR